MPIESRDGTLIKDSKMSNFNVDPFEPQKVAKRYGTERTGGDVNIVTFPFPDYVAVGSCNGTVSNTNAAIWESGTLTNIQPSDILSTGIDGADISGTRTIFGTSATVLGGQQLPCRWEKSGSAYVQTYLPMLAGYTYNGGVLGYYNGYVVGYCSTGSAHVPVYWDSAYAVHAFTLLAGTTKGYAYRASANGIYGVCSTAGGFSKATRWDWATLTPTELPGIGYSAGVIATCEDSGIIGGYTGLDAVYWDSTYAVHTLPKLGTSSAAVNESKNGILVGWSVKSGQRPVYWDVSKNSVNRLPLPTGFSSGNAMAFDGRLIYGYGTNSTDGNDYGLIWDFYNAGSVYFSGSVYMPKQSVQLSRYAGSGTSLTVYGYL